MGVVTSGLFFIGGTFAITFGVYFATRFLLGARSDSDARELASSMVFRVAALHGLILALVFAQELSNLNNLKQAIDNEANQLEGIFNDLQRFADTDGPNVVPTKNIRKTIALYVREAIGSEWASLNDQRRLSVEASNHWNEVYRLILDLPTTNERQTWLRGHMLTKIDAVNIERDAREIAAATDISPVFWIVSYIGVAAIAALYFTFAPSLVNIFLLTVYSIYISVVLFFIDMFDYPFSSLGLVRPVALQVLYDQYLAPLL
jgi:hypothetical protein